MRFLWFQRARQRVIAKLPLSCARGVAAQEAGRFEAWLEQGRRAAEVFDGLVLVFFFFSAAGALASLFWASAWCAAAAGVAMASAFFCMAVALWISDQAEKVYDQRRSNGQ